jgi:hypothetical protein
MYLSVAQSSTKSQEATLDITNFICGSLLKFL